MSDDEFYGSEDEGGADYSISDEDDDMEEEEVQYDEEAVGYPTKETMGRIGTGVVALGTGTGTMMEGGPRMPWIELLIKKVSMLLDHEYNQLSSTARNEVSKRLLEIPLPRLTTFHVPTLTYALVYRVTHTVLRVDELKVTMRDITNIPDVEPMDAIRYIRMLYQLFPS